MLERTSKNVDEILYEGADRTSELNQPVSRKGIEAEILPGTLLLARQ